MTKNDIQVEIDTLEQKQEQMRLAMATADGALQAFKYMLDKLDKVDVTPEQADFTPEQAVPVVQEAQPATKSRRKAS